jgi:hypothetical protein
LLNFSPFSRLEISLSPLPADKRHRKPPLLIISVGIVCSICLDRSESCSVSVGPISLQLSSHRASRRSVQGCSSPQSVSASPVCSSLQHLLLLPYSPSKSTLYILRWTLRTEFAFDIDVGAKMAGYTPAKRLAVATVFVPLLAIILYQAVNLNWYARTTSYVSTTPYAAGSADKFLSRDTETRWALRLSPIAGYTCSFILLFETLGSIYPCRSFEGL